jgi:hypothetical protein
MPIPVPKPMLDQVEKDLGLTSRETWRREIMRVATAFFFQKVGIDDPHAIASHIKGIDLDWPVKVVDLLPGEELIAYRFNPQRLIQKFDPFGMYYTKAGVARESLGIPTNDRRFVKYKVKMRVPALESRAKTGLVPYFGPVEGGAMQYVVPEAYRHLEPVFIQHSVP